MSKASQEYLENCINNAIDRCRVEWNMTYGEVVGLFAFIIHNMMHEADEDEQ